MNRECPQGLARTSSHKISEVAPTPSYHLTVQMKKSEIHPVPDTSEEEAIPIDIFTSREYLKGQCVSSLGNKVICRWLYLSDKPNRSNHHVTVEGQY